MGLREVLGLEQGAGLEDGAGGEAGDDDHASRPRNRKLAEMLYYAGSIEKWGGGTLAIIRGCQNAGLPDPRFEEKQGGLWLTFPKDELTEEHLRSLGLNGRQTAAALCVKKSGRITNSEYQRLCSIGKRAASVELKQLEMKRVLEKIGSTGKGTHYRIKGSKGAGRDRRKPTGNFSGGRIVYLEGSEAGL